jgi:hypothetical protein
MDFPVCVQLFAVRVVSEFQVRPGVMSVASRQNQLPTLLFKNGTVVPIQQASGLLIGYCISIICGSKYSGSHCTTSNQIDSLEKVFVF